MLPHVFPIIPGWDAAGTIAKLGAGVSDVMVVTVLLPTPDSRSTQRHLRGYISVPVNFVAKIQNTRFVCRSGQAYHWWH